jgi:hypothetical protein
MADIDYEKMGEAVARALKRGGGYSGGGGSGGSAGGGGSPDGGTFRKSMEALGDATKDTAKDLLKSGELGLDTFRQLSKGGTNFSNSLDQMGVAALQSRMNLKDFADVIQTNGKNLAGLGGSVTRGAEAFAKLSKGFFDTGMTDELRQLGYTSKELNEVLAIQASTQRSTMGNDAASRKKAYDSAEALAREMDMIAKLTGKSREEQMEAAKKRASDGQVEAKLRLIGLEQGAEAEAAARAAFQKQFAEAEARGMGQMAKELFATGTVTSDEAATQYALLGEAAQKTGEQMKYLSEGNIKAAEASSKEADAANAKNQRDPTLLRIATLGDAAGTAGNILKKNVEDNMALHDSIMAVSKTMKPGLTDSTASFGKALDKAREDIKASSEGKDASGRQVSGVTRGAIAVGTAVENAQSGIASAANARNEKGESITGAAQKVGAGVDARLAKEGNIAKRIEGAAQEGQTGGAKPEGTSPSAQRDASGGVVGAITSGLSKLGNIGAEYITTKVLKVENLPAHAEGGYIPNPEIALIGEKGPEWVLNASQMKDTIENAGMTGVKNVLGKLPAAGGGGSGNINLKEIASSISTSISSVTKAPAAAKSTAPIPTVVEQSMSMGKMTLKDDQKKVFDEMMTMNSKQANEKLESLKAEETAARAANKAAADARDAIEEKYEAEGKSIKDIAGEDKVRFDALTKQMNESYDASDKAQSAIKAAERAEATRLNLQKMGYEVGVKQEEDKAKIVEEQSEKIKTDIANALPVKDIADKVEEAKTVLSDHQKSVLKYAYEDSEGKQMQLDNQKNRIKGELNSIAEKNKQIEDIQNEADGRELTRREQNRIEKLQKEIEGGKESLKFREEELFVYQNLDKLKAENEIKAKTETVTAVEKQNEKITADIKDALGTATEKLTVNGKDVDPKSDEGKAALEQMEKVKAGIQSTIGGVIKELPNALGTATEKLTVNGKDVDPKSDEGKAAMAQMETAKAEMSKFFKDGVRSVAPNEAGKEKDFGKIGVEQGAEAEAKARYDALKKSAGSVEDKQEGKQIPTPKASSIGVDLNAINLPGFGPQLKSGTASIPEKKASPGKKINPETGEEYTPLPDKAAKPKKEETASTKETASKKDATLSDVVTSLNMLNKQMGQLLSQQDELGRKQIQATQANSSNVYAKQ